MLCRCKRHLPPGRRNVVEVPAARTTIEHTPLDCWLVRHGKQPKPIDGLNQPSPVTFIRHYY